MGNPYDAATGRILTDLLERAREKVREFADIQRTTKANADASSTALEGMRRTVAEMVVLSEAIAQTIARNVPEHEWNGTLLRMINPNGGFGVWTDLRGERGLQGLKGDRGLQGERGLQGLKGDKGDTGADGPAGAQGLPFEVNDKGTLAGRVVFDNQPAGFSYLATDVGLLFFREDAPGVWSDGLPFGRGEKGDTGSQGIKGNTGDRGLQGLKGDAGARGDKGETGAKGADAVITKESIDAAGAFNADNFKEGTNTKIMKATERESIGKLKALAFLDKLDGGAY